ncbi:pyridoxamine 5'-phosphate oxidase family protein [Streptomyces sp. AJS327]|uniref:pyridoxamine 5'-phosphate oxidase family protein n=1 Tax=Streptomyces sp. AJS327 TaxID=2545265 RepID=UPI0015DE0057|nr:pyridoxamine 5'-phosphate oxidase family protein [Streptomyces sp. AJS327]MBA0049442.1 pyridoxamine 5'-phosphate oxidase family protein [Streptomyces sp. AJS327]
MTAGAAGETGEGGAAGGAVLPHSHLDLRYSEPDVDATEWSEARELLAEAELYWLTTVRPDGRPHVTPLLAVWRDERPYFCTGPEERKARNLAREPRCALTTGRNSLGPGLDVVLEGTAERVRDTAELEALAAAWVAKYGPDWRFTVRDGMFWHGGGDGGSAEVYTVVPDRVFGFGKRPYSQTRWTFRPRWPVGLGGTGAF